MPKKENRAKESHTVITFSVRLIWLNNRQFSPAFPHL